MQNKTRVFKITTILMLFTAILPVANAQQSDSMNLEEIIEATISHSQKLKIAQYQSEQTDLDRKRALRSYLPKISAEAGYTILDDDIKFDDDFNSLLMGNQWLLIKEQTGLPFNQQPTPELMAMLSQNGVEIKEIPPIQEKEYFKANVTAQMILFSGGKIPYLAKAAKHKRNAIELMSEQERTKLTLEVVKYYDQFAVTYKSEEVLDDTENMINNQKEFVEKAFKNGLLTKLDLHKLELAQQKVDVKRVELETAKKLLTAKLSQMTGMEAARFYNVKPELNLIFINENTGDISTRNDIKSIEEAIKASDYKVKSEYSEFMPKVVAFGKKELVKDNLTMFDPEWAVGLKLKWNVFDGFSSTAKVKQAKIDKLILQEKKDEAIELLSLKLTKEALDLDKNFKLIELAGKKVEVATKTFELSEKQYKHGLVSQNDHLNTLLALEKAKLEKIKAIYNQRVAALNYLDTKGSLNFNSIIN